MDQLLAVRLVHFRVGFAALLRKFQAPAIRLKDRDGAIVRLEADHAVIAQRMTDSRIDRDEVREDDRIFFEFQ